VIFKRLYCHRGAGLGDAVVREQLNARATHNRTAGQHERDGASKQVVLAIHLRDHQVRGFAIELPRKRGERISPRQSCASDMAGSDV
jgi:hypothetical protein